MTDERNPVRRTEVDGREALWKLATNTGGDRHIEIMEATDTNTGEHRVFPPGTDLVDARAQTPAQWRTLWDGVAHRMWRTWSSIRAESSATDLLRRGLS